MRRTDVSERVVALLQQLFHSTVRFHNHFQVFIEFLFSVAGRKDFFSKLLQPLRESGGASMLIVNPAKGNTKCLKMGVKCQAPEVRSAIELRPKLTNFTPQMTI